MGDAEGSPFLDTGEGFGVFFFDLSADFIFFLLLVTWFPPYNGLYYSGGKVSVIVGDIDSGGRKKSHRKAKKTKILLIYHKRAKNQVKKMERPWKSELFAPFVPEDRPAKGVGPVDEISAPPLLLALNVRRRPVLAVFPALAEAEAAQAGFQLWAKASQRNVRSLLLPDGTPTDRMAASTDGMRARVLHELLNDPPDILFASGMGMIHPAPSVKAMKKSSFTIRRGMELPLTRAAELLVELDYDDEETVTVPGEFSRRGGILDIFSTGSDRPVRIEFFGDTVDSLRYFSPETQRSEKAAEEYEIILRTGSANGNCETGRVTDYLAEWKPLLVPVFPSVIRSRLERFQPETAEEWDRVLAGSRATLPFLDAAETARTRDVTPPPFFALHGELEKALPEGGEKNFFELGKRWMQSSLKRWVESEEYQAVLLSGAEGDLVHFRQWLTEAGLENDPRVSLEQACLPGGLFSPGHRLVLLTEQEIFAAPSRMRLPSGAEKTGSGEESPEGGGDAADGTPGIDSSGDLEEGDYAVHLNLGVCIYRGLAMVRAGGVRAEMIRLEFADEEVVHVPMHQAYLISRYIGAGRKTVPLSSARSSKWGKTLATAAASVRNMAYDMLRLQAVRSSMKGTSFPEDGLEQRLFEQAFPFQETPDQLRSAEEIKRDMESEKPMDRLLCGDVGYGKTELAMRAAFKCVMSGRQVAVLVPTTVLAQQHYYSFLQRFAGTPVVIEQLSRFRSKAEQAGTLARMKSGGVDIVIGTHRLVQDDVDFKNRGLIVIDEEQRFGVLHKEKLKRLRTSADVLTMTATPIPRTLYLSMSGMREISTILSAPVRRMPVQTMIVQDEPAVVRNAVARELQRGGQVYFVHNRVKGIQDAAGKLQEMFPQARIGIGHGQMAEEELEDVMSRFIENKIDILVCTTIIESGLDIPNANTIIIDRADRFGLAELYQLRGRVGRWTRQAYAYLLLPKHGILTGDARQRIAAMRRYTHLGAGFKLAMSDLQIRGAGNILGAEQSGQIHAVGFHLYCELLRDCIAQLNRREDRREASVMSMPDIRLDFLDYAEEPAPGRLGAALPAGYIPSEKLRFQAYRRLALFRTQDQIDSFEEELRDRFGPLPGCARTLLRVTSLRLLAAEKGITAISVHEGKAILEKAHAVVKPNGVIPRIPDIMRPADRLERLFRILKELPSVVRN